jgi:hypothetical protein
MNKRHIYFFILTVLAIISSTVHAQKVKHTFSFSETEFLLDDEPFQIISGEMHPARITMDYWRQRIQMAKAMGCNTISVCIFWNFHESEEGVFDFSTENRNIGEFIKTVLDEDMWLIIRPGPYVRGEWDLGGIPPYLLRIPDIKLRCMDPRYMEAAERYIARLAVEIRPWLITKGGPIIMIQIENDYGSSGNDRDYLKRLKEVWTANGIDVPTFTSDGPTTYMLEAGTLPGSAVGLNSGSSSGDFELAAKMNPGVPVFRSEISPGRLTHWGEEWANCDTVELMNEVKFLMDNKKSFNFYVIHGGTNFGFTAGANSDQKGYEPDLTSYDYNAPINEQGWATSKYIALRNLIGSYLPKGVKKMPKIPDPIPAIEIPLLFPERLTSIWDNLPQPVESETPKPFEYYGQDYGFILYRTELIGQKAGELTVTDIHDYATVFLNGEYIGSLDRREGLNTIELPESNIPNPVLEILVEGMGRINYGQNLIDRKGITDGVTLNGITLMNWKAYKLPMDKKFIYNLRSSGKVLNKQGIFFRGLFSLAYIGDTYFDVSNYSKGMVWVNGHNLGRYWEIGPQKRLFCPSSYIKPGLNEILIFDLHLTEPKPVRGVISMEGM